MKLLAVLSLLLLLAAPVHAQDRKALTFYLAAAGTDIGTTYRNMRAGHQETDPIYRFTRDQPIGTVLSLAATDALTLWLAHRYAPTHPKLTTAILLTLGGVRGVQAARNAQAWYQDTHRPFDLSAH